MTAIAKPDLATRLACPRLYTTVIGAVRTMVPEQHVEDVVHKAYVEAMKKPQEAPEDDAMLPAWLKAFARHIAPRHMSRQRRERIATEEQLEGGAVETSEDDENIARLRALEPESDKQAQVIEDVVGLLRGETIADRARSRGEKPNTASKRAWRHAPAIAALLSSALLIAVLLMAVFQLAARPGAAPDVRPGPTTMPPPAMSTPVPPPAPSVVADPVAAAEARDAAFKACDQKKWLECYDGLGKAMELDPSLKRDPKVQQAYELAFDRSHAKP
jgi:DNA-directed RNA polymerase specialized sigma24 family protein